MKFTKPFCPSSVSNFAYTFSKACALARATGFFASLFVLFDVSRSSYLPDWDHPTRHCSATTSPLPQVVSVQSSYPTLLHLHTLNTTLLFFFYQSSTLPNDRRSFRTFNLNLFSFNLHHFIPGATCSGLVLLPSQISHSINSTLCYAATLSLFLPRNSLFLSNHFSDMRNSLWLSLLKLL